jgi:hypothetical protein
MQRRIVWKYGDSSPLYGHVVAALEGNGSMYICTGFPVSAAEVAFSKSYNRWLIETYGYNYQSYAFAPEVYVESTDDSGFTLTYNNIADALEINYFVM